MSGVFQVGILDQVFITTCDGRSSMVGHVTQVYYGPFWTNLRTALSGGSKCRSLHLKKNKIPLSTEILIIKQSIHGVSMKIVNCRCDRFPR